MHHTRRQNVNEYVALTSLTNCFLAACNCANQRSACLALFKAPTFHLRYSHLGLYTGEHIHSADLINITIACSAKVIIPCLQGKAQQAPLAPASVQTCRATHSALACLVCNKLFTLLRCYAQSRIRECLVSIDKAANNGTPRFCSA